MHLIITFWQDSTYQGDRFNGHMGSQQHSQYLSQFSQVLLFGISALSPNMLWLLIFYLSCAFAYSDLFSAVRRCRVSAPKIGGSFPEVISSKGGLQSKHFLQELEMTEATGKSLPPRPRGRRSPMWGGGKSWLLLSAEKNADHYCQLKQSWLLSSADAVEIGWFCIDAV